MVDWIERIEGRLARIESWALVVCVVGMLLLAGYNVLYRNALIPLQGYLRTTGPTVESTGERSGDGTEEPGGFEGGFGDGAEEEAPESGEPSGFEGGFGGGEGDEPSEEGSDGAGGATGFEGGFGGGEASEGESGGDGELEVKGAERDERRAREPPGEGTWADAAIEVIDAMRVAWIDVLLRQLVLVVGFLGAMVAVRRREHITIDAVGQLIEGRVRHTVDAVTSLVAVGVCAVLAMSGWQLVELGMRHPRDLLPWAPQWTFQVMFPAGFGLMALHFLLRAVASGTEAWRGDEEAG
jgi:TRAP-type C4-dicarboxylate transport system permease small subunit